MGLSTTSFVQFGQSSPMMTPTPMSGQNMRPMTSARGVEASPRVDTGGTYKGIGSRLGMEGRGSGGFNVAGMASVGGGGALGWRID